MRTMLSVAVSSVFLLSQSLAQHCSVGRDSKVWIFNSEAGKLLEWFCGMGALPMASRLAGLEIINPRTRSAWNRGTVAAIPATADRLCVCKKCKV